MASSNDFPDMNKTDEKRVPLWTYSCDERSWTDVLDISLTSISSVAPTRRDVGNINETRSQSGWMVEFVICLIVSELNNVTKFRTVFQSSLNNITRMMLWLKALLRTEAAAAATAGNNLKHRRPKWPHDADESNSSISNAHWWLAADRPIGTSVGVAASLPTLKWSRGPDPWRLLVGKCYCGK